MCLLRLTSCKYAQVAPHSQRRRCLSPEQKPQSESHRRVDNLGAGLQMAGSASKGLSLRTLLVMPGLSAAAAAITHHTLQSRLMLTAGGTAYGGAAVLGAAAAAAAGSTNNR